LTAFLNGHQVFYIALCYASLAVTIGLGARTIWMGWLEARSGTLADPPHWTQGIAFLLALAGTVVLFRLPAILTDRVLNLDEYSEIVGGWSLLRDPAPWRACDGHTLGPLNFFILTAAFWIGLPIKVMTARIVMVALALALIGCTYGTLRKLSSPLAAVPAALALGMFFAFAREEDHVHYNSESLSVALLAVALLCYMHGRDRPAGRVMLVYGAGLLLGAIPYAKSQAAPLGVFLAMVFAIDLWQAQRARSDGWRPLLTLALGGVSVPLLMTLVLLITGTWRDFLMSYLHYVPSYRHDVLPRIVTVLNPFLGPDMPWFLLYCLVVGLGAFACLGRISGVPLRRSRLLLCACLGYLAVAVFAVEAPQCGFRHYSSLLLHPVALLLGVCFAQVAGLLAEGVNRGRQLGAEVAAVWASAATAGLIAVHICGCRIDMTLERPFPLTLVRQPGNWWVPFLPVPPPQVFPVAKVIARLARPGDCMSVWGGWVCHYYVYASVPNATRDPGTVEAMSASPWTAGMGDAVRHYYRQRYLADLRRAMPAFFVDAVSSSEFYLTDRKQLGHESWPELAALIADNYVKVFENEVGPGDGTRVYMLKARAARQPYP